MKPTDAQLRVLDAIRRWCDAHRYAPTNRDLMEVLRFASTNAVADHLRALRRHGWVDWEHLKARSLFITPLGLQAMWPKPRNTSSFDGRRQQ